MKQFRKTGRAGASITVEAALVLPLFIYFFIALIYFLQIFIVQEHIQSAITKTGLSLAKTAYVYDDFADAAEAMVCDHSLWEEALDTGIGEMAYAALEGTAVRELVKNKLDTGLIDRSCILDGFSGISFYYSNILDESDNIDIIARYRIRLPICFFGLGDMRMIQRVKLRGWTGIQIPPGYIVVEENQDGAEEKMVYIAETGLVYHLNASCSHIKLSVKQVLGKPEGYRNESGGKYYPCDSCCRDGYSDDMIYYITDYGSHYHRDRDCSGIKRTVKQVPLSEAVGRKPCSRCGGG